MELEKAITTALDYEVRIRDLYLNLAQNAPNSEGRELFSALQEDEQRHVDYLNHLLDQWRQHGVVTKSDLATTIPSKKKIEASLAKLQPVVDRDDHKMEQQMLSKALEMEVATSRFYQQLIADIDEQYRPLFMRFLEIENAHIDIVQAQLDYIIGTGYWFDIKEFDMSGD
jgi:rubrerythrin